jgi:hypothetical protein
MTLHPLSRFLRLTWLSRVPCLVGGAVSALWPRRPQGQRGKPATARLILEILET